MSNKLHSALSRIFQLITSDCYLGEWCEKHDTEDNSQIEELLVISCELFAFDS